MLSQAELARLAGVSPSVVSRIELDRRPPRWDVVQRLLASLDLQARLVLEPLDAHVDALLAAEAARPPLEWLLDAVFDVVPAIRLAHQLGLLLDGTLAARLHGVQVPLGDVELVVPPTCSDGALELAADAAWLGMRCEGDDDRTWWCRRQERFVVARRPEVLPPSVLVVPPRFDDGREQLPGPLRVVAVDRLRLDIADERLVLRALRRRGHAA